MKPIKLTSVLTRIQIRYIRLAYYQANGNITRTAELLGLNRTTLQMWMKRNREALFDIEPKKPEIS